MYQLNQYFCKCEKIVLGPPTPMKPVDWNICSSCKHIHINQEYCGHDINFAKNEVCDCRQDKVLNDMIKTEADMWEGRGMVIGSTRNPWLNQVLSKIAQLHDKKNHDYCPDDDNPFFNFECSAKYANVALPNRSTYKNFTSEDSFNILLGTKLARLYALLTRGGLPNNEAFVDSEWDYVVYFLLRESYKLKMEEEKK